MKRIGTACSCICLALALTPCGQATAVTIALVPVGNPGNPADTRYDPAGFGSVEYAYQIAKFETSNGQYREFLNAKATVGDPHGLYNVSMASEQCGIERFGSGTPADPWSYQPKNAEASWDSRPVNFVSIWDAARFVNWLHNGQGNGDTESGAYAGLDSEDTFTRQPGARFFLPTENEWYKAAYYDPAKDGSGGYWEFPTRSDTKPSNDAPPGADMANGSANYGSADLTPVGAYSARPSDSAYGTFDQGGNLWEWNESFVTEQYFGLRGGSFDNIYGLEAAHRDSYPAFFENPIMGFRVAAAVPEPSGVWLLAVGASAMAWACRRSRASRA